MAKHKTKQNKKAAVMASDVEDQNILNAFNNTVSDSNTQLADRKNRVGFEVVEGDDGNDYVKVTCHQYNLLKIFFAAAYDSDFEAELFSGGHHSYVLINCTDYLMDAVNSGDLSQFETLKQKIKDKEKVHSLTGGFIASKEKRGRAILLSDEMHRFCEGTYVADVKNALDKNVPLLCKLNSNPVYKTLESAINDLPEISVDPQTILDIPHNMEVARIPKEERTIFFRAIENHPSLRPLHDLLGGLEPGTQMIPVSTKQNITEETRAVS